MKTPDEFEGRSYEDVAGTLLAEISDLLLGDKKNWGTLMRLQLALHPPKPEIHDHHVSRDIFADVPSMTDIIREATKEAVRQDRQNKTVHSYPIYTSSTTTSNYKYYPSK